jgi:hypothetical protein
MVRRRGRRIEGRRGEFYVQVSTDGKTIDRSGSLILAADYYLIINLTVFYS